MSLIVVTSLQLLLAIMISQTFFIFDDLDSLKSADEMCFVGCQPLGICLTFFLWLERDIMWFLRKTVEANAIFITLYQGSILWIYHCWCWSRLSVSVAFVRHLHCEVFFPISSYSVLRKEVALCRPDLTRILHSCHLKVECPTRYSEFCIKDLSIVLHLLIFLLNHLFTSMWTNEYLFGALYIFSVYPYSDMYFINFFSICGLSLTVLLVEQKFFVLISLKNIHSFFRACSFDTVSPNPKFFRFCHIFSSGSFIILHFTIRSLIHFEFFFYETARSVSRFFFSPT